MSTKTVTGTNSSDTIILTDSGTDFNVSLNSVTTGPFPDDTLIVNGNGGNDNINLSLLTSASGVTSITVNGGNDNDTITGTNSKNLDDLLATNPTVPISIPRSGTPSPTVWNLTSEGRMDTNGDGSNDFSVWRMENGTATDLTVTLRVYGSSVVWTGTLPAMSNTFFASPSITGTHILDSILGSKTKAGNTKVFNYDTAIGVNDILNGDSGNDTIYGMGGNDTINGGAGIDVIIGGDGNDTILVREDDSQSDTIDGGAGNDTIKVNGNWVRFENFNAATSSIETFDASGKIVYGNASDNTLDFSGLTSVMNSHPDAGNGLYIDAQDGDDTVTGTKFNDLVNAGNGKDTVYGGDGNDTLNGQAGDDNLNGGNGNDTLYGNSGNDSVDGGAGDDTIQVREDDSQFDTIQGGTETDTVQVLGNWVRFNGFNAATSSIETFDANRKIVYGNASDNTLDFSGLTSVMNSHPDAGNGLYIDAQDGDDTVTGTKFNDLVNAGNGKDTVYGGDGNDTLNGQAGDDNLNGGNGDDTLNGSSGNDIINGDAGNDTIQVREDDSQFDTIQGGTETDTVQVLGNWVRFNGFNAATSSIETFDANSKIVYGNASGNTFDFSYLTTVLGSTTGGGLNIDAQDGNDTVTGTKFNDLVNAGNGDDTVYGGVGNDTLNGQAGDDELNGGDGDDTLYGNSGKDTINGDAGKDTILVREDDSQLGTINGGDDIDTIKVNGNWVRFDSFNAATSSIETFDASGKIVYGNASDNALDFSYLSNVLGGTTGGGLYIEAQEGNDTVKGTKFDDLVNAGNGNDSVYGGEGNDTLNGQAGDDELNGGDGDDTLYGNSGKDTINGDAGKDTILVREGDSESDVINGGADTDTIKVNGNWVRFSNFNASTSSIEVVDGSGKNVHGNNDANEFDFSAAQLINVAQINLENGNDTVTTSTNHSVVTTYDGQGGTGDKINLVFTAAQLSGFSVSTINDINDYVAAPTGKTLNSSNALNLGFTAKNFESATVNVLVDNQLYNISNCLVGIDNVVTMTTSSYTDAAGKNSLIIGTTVANNINASDAHDMVFGGAGNDSITGGDGSDCLFGGADNDTFYASSTQAEFDVLQGGSGIDTLQRTNAVVQSNLVLNGFSSSNGIEQINLDYAGSNRAIEGNAGNNILDFSALTYLSGSVFGLDGKDTITATSSATRTYDGGNGDDTLNGGTFADVLIGGAGDDSIFGNGGNDLITGGAGIDNLNGGDGSDVYYASSNEAEFDTFTDTGTSGVDILQRTNAVIQSNLVLNGFSSSNGIEQINLDYAGSNRAIDGNAGDNILDFSALTYLSGSVFGLDGKDTITATNSATRTYDGGNGNDTLNGGTFADVLIGGAGDDSIFGNGGNDSITGGAGDDNLSGGDGSDVYYASSNEAEFDTFTDTGTSGVDILQRTNAVIQSNLVLNGFSSSNGIEQINLDYAGSNRAIDGNTGNNILDFSALTYLSGNVFGLGGNDTITATNSATRTYDGGDGADTLNGGTLADVLIGGEGNDSIFGNGGNDKIYGGTGLDNLTGGDGNDVFFINNAIEGMDTITDFNVADDQFTVSTAGFTGIGGLGTLSASRFLADVGGVATNASQRFIYDTDGGQLYFDADGNGGGAAVQIAQLGVNLLLTNSDFSIGF